ncbi:MAG TPA: C-terminal binding protein [Armatimonadota bacterium]|jgi:D-3-phosphoglycerate dehydrogenase
MPDRIKFVVTDYIEADLDWEVEQFSSRPVDFAYYQLKNAPIEELAAKTRDADVILVNMAPITRELIALWDRPKLVIRHGIGYDNVDVAALTDAGIMFGYQPDYCVEEVAEHAIALLFASARKVVPGRKCLEKSSAAGKWDFSEVMPLYRMAGKTLGIIGCGRVGSRVLQKLQSFGFNFLVCDPYLSADRQAELGIEVVDHETLFRNADFITCHTPLTPETRHMINAESLALMKPTAYLINTSRGPVVDHEALAAVLRANQIAGAAIDVYDVEPPPPDYPLFPLDNALLAPHLAWASEEANWVIRKNIVGDVDRFTRGEGPRSWVNQKEMH